MPTGGPGASNGAACQSVIQVIQPGVRGSDGGKAGTRDACGARRSARRRGPFRGRGEGQRRRDRLHGFDRQRARPGGGRQPRPEQPELPVDRLARSGVDRHHRHVHGQRRVGADDDDCERERDGAAADADPRQHEGRGRPDLHARRHEGGVRRRDDRYRRGRVAGRRRRERDRRRLADRGARLGSCERDGHRGRQQGDRLPDEARRPPGRRRQRAAEPQDHCRLRRRERNAGRPRQCGRRDELQRHRPGRQGERHAHVRAGDGHRPRQGGEPRRRRPRARQALHGGDHETAGRDVRGRCDDRRDRDDHRVRGVSDPLHGFDRQRARPGGGRQPGPEPPQLPVDRRAGSGVDRHHCHVHGQRRVGADDDDCEGERDGAAADADPRQHEGRGRQDLHPRHHEGGVRRRDDRYRRGRVAGRGRRERDRRRLADRRARLGSRERDGHRGRQQGDRLPDEARRPPGRQRQRAAEPQDHCRLRRRERNAGRPRQCGQRDELQHHRPGRPGRQGERHAHVRAGDGHRPRQGAEPRRRRPRARQALHGGDHETAGRDVRGRCDDRRDRDDHRVGRASDPLHGFDRQRARPGGGRQPGPEPPQLPVDRRARSGSDGHHRHVHGQRRVGADGDDCEGDGAAADADPRQHEGRGRQDLHPRHHEGGVRPARRPIPSRSGRRPRPKGT